MSVLETFEMELDAIHHEHADVVVFTLRSKRHSELTREISVEGDMSDILLLLVMEDNPQDSVEYRNILKQYRVSHENIEEVVLYLGATDVEAYIYLRGPAPQVPCEAFHALAISCASPVKLSVQRELVTLPLLHQASEPEPNKDLLYSDPNKSFSLIGHA
jgi:hypothetical protein